LSPARAIPTTDAARKHATVGIAALAVKLKIFAMVSHLPGLNAFARFYVFDSL
jgi:hypothetical protein